MAFNQVVKNGTIASAASTSGNFDLGSYFQYVHVYVGTMSTAAAINVQQSPNSGSTFYNCFQVVNSTTTAANAVVIVSGLGTGGGHMTLPIPGRFFRFIASATVDNGVSFTVVGIG